MGEDYKARAEAAEAQEAALREAISKIIDDLVARTLAEGDLNHDTEAMDEVLGDGRGGDRGDGLLPVA